MEEPLGLDRLRRVRCWVFDLDNTLYPPSASLFPQVDRRMTQFIADYLGVEWDEAYRLQKTYYRAHGTTLRGLMTIHGIEPATFLDYVHDIDHGVLPADPLLDAALDRLPGRKVVFTNGSEAHAGKVLERLGIARHFEAVFDIHAADYLPKPEPETYRRMLDQLAVDPAEAAMVEDLEVNLRPAARLGMVTVWVHGDPERLRAQGRDISHCHVIVGDLVPWLTSVAAALAPR